MKDNFNFLKYIKANPLLNEESQVSSDPGVQAKYVDLVKAANAYDYYSEYGGQSKFQSGGMQRDKIVGAIKDLVDSGKVDWKQLQSALTADVKGDAKPEDVKKNIGYWFSNWSKSDAKAAAEAVKTAYQKYGDAVITNQEKYGIDPNITIGNWKTPYKANVNEPDAPEIAPIEYQGQVIDFLRKPAGEK